MALRDELLDFSKFDINAILRGVQLTFVGAQRALQNPDLWTTQHYRQVVIAVGCGIAIRVLVEIPVILVKMAIWFLSLVMPLDRMSWDESVIDGLRFVQDSVLQVPFFLMSLLRHVTPAMDDLFMISLKWVDQTYAKKHERDGPIDPSLRYYDNLRVYAEATKGVAVSSSSPSSSLSSSSSSSTPKFVSRFARKALLSLAVFALSYVPLIGRFVLPAVSFYTFRSAVGLGPAALIFGTGLFLPRRYLVSFLQIYYGQRSVMRELLVPYFQRLRLSPAQKRHWFASREGLLFGFGAGFYVLLRVPLVGVVVYGIAEASAAYLVTKITDPPPAAEAVAATALARRSEKVKGSAGSASASSLAQVHAAYSESQQQWHNRRAFLDLALDNLDALQRQRQEQQQLKEKQ